LTSTAIPVVMVGSDLRIRRLTPPTRWAMNILPTDVGRPIGDFKTNVDVPDLEALIGEVIEQVQPQEREVRDREGHWYLLRVYPYRTADHKIDGAVVVLLDIDQLKRNQEALRQSEQRFARFMQHLPGLAWIKDLEGRYVYANDAVEKAFRTPRERLYGKTDDEVFPRETATQFKANDRQALADGTSIQVVETLKHEDGVLHHLIVSKFPIVGPGGQAMLIGGIAIDITDRLRAEEALREADRRKDEFLAMLSHELRNPLAPIRNALEIVKRLDLKDQQLDWACAVLDGQLDNLTHIVDDLLDVSRITRGKMNLHRKRLDLASVIERAVETNRPLIEARGQVLTIHLSPEPIPLEGDLARLSQVVSNLLNNAAKCTNAGGQIDISAGIEDDMAVIRVRDNGSGIAPELLPRVFDLFTQSAQFLDRARGGLGIGLALVKRLWRHTAPGPGRAASSSCGYRLLPSVSPNHCPRYFRCGPQAGSRSSWSTTIPMRRRAWRYYSRWRGTRCARRRVDRQRSK
jgi:two-component system CheB/CheR fusion protein